MSTSTRDCPKVLLTALIAAGPLSRLQAATDLRIWKREEPPTGAELVELIAEVDGILSMVVNRLDAKTIGAARNLRAISNFGVGVDNIDLAAATARGIAVGHTPGVLTNAVADLTFALMMAVARRVVEADRYVRQGRWRTWSPGLLLGRDIYGATLGVIGMGRIGQAVARCAAGYGMRVLSYAKNSNFEIAGVQRVVLEELLRASDFVAVAVALTPQTQHLLGARELSLMKPGAILVNTARGPIVDQKALVAALRSGHLGGAGLDVAEKEPIAIDDPLLALDNVVLTPHIGSASTMVRTRMGEMAVDNLLETLAGRKPRHCANPEVRLRDS